MPLLVFNGARLSCDFGTASSALQILPITNLRCDGGPAATIMDNRPITNITPFGMCASLTNPTVAAATAAAMGVLTPMPCIPASVDPWSPGSSEILLDDQPALHSDCKLTCSYGGQISILNPGQTSLTCE